jgi:phage terminase small subunit
LNQEFDMQKRRPQPPPHLAAPTKTWWKSVVEDYDLEPHHLRLLQLAAEAWDRCEQARDALAANGLTYLDRFEAPHARPEVAIERDNRTAFARLIRELDLDVDPPAERSRPPGLRSNRRP